MLTFFRRIRKGLLDGGRTDESPTSQGLSVSTSQPASLREESSQTHTRVSGPAGRYLLYAIGEILLVMIGILLALQVNNWNETEKSKRVEQELLIGLLSEMRGNRENLEDILTAHERIFNSIGSLLGLFNENVRLSDVHQIDSLLGNIGAGHTFDPRFGLLKSIVSSGKMTHIRNQELAALIAGFEDAVSDATEDMDFAHEIWRQQAAPIMSQYFPYNSEGKARIVAGKYPVSVSRFPIRHQELFQDRRLESRLAHMNIFIGETIVEEKDLLETIEEMITLIENEIN